MHDICNLFFVARPFWESADSPLRRPLGFQSRYRCKRTLAIYYIFWSSVTTSSFTVAAWVFSSNRSMISAYGMPTWTLVIGRFFNIRDYFTLCAERIFLISISSASSLDIFPASPNAFSSFSGSSYSSIALFSR